MNLIIARKITARVGIKTAVEPYKYWIPWLFLFSRLRFISFFKKSEENYEIFEFAFSISSSN